MPRWVLRRFGALITLFVTLYDLYRPVYDIRALEAVAAQVRPDVAQR
jgi:hypothetical protein